MRSGSAPVRLLSKARSLPSGDQAGCSSSKSPEVTWVSYPGLESHPSHKLAKRYLTGGYGGIVTFGVKGGVSAGRRLIDNVQIFSLLANVGDAKSLVIHPATTTHYRMDEAALLAAGITAGTVRLSIGLEDAGDLLEDLNRALYASQKA